MRANCAKCTGDASAECAVEPSGPTAAGVLLGRFTGPDGQIAAGALCRAEGGMSMADPGSVGCSRGMAVVRAAEAMIQALGGEEVTVLFPVVALPDDPAAQLGLADPGVQEVAISPVVVRNLRRSEERRVGK